MWVEQIVGNVVDQPDHGIDPVDYLDLRWDQCDRVLKSKTRSGTPIRVLLPPGGQMRHGDILAPQDCPQRVIVNVLPCELIVACPAAAREMALLCLELGNLHCPAQVTDNEIILIEDGPPLAVLDQLKIPWFKDTRRFEPSPVGSGPGIKLARPFQIIRRESAPNAPGL